MSSRTIFPPFSFDVPRFAALNSVDLISYFAMSINIRTACVFFRIFFIFSRTLSFSVTFFACRSGADCVGLSLSIISESSSVSISLSMSSKPIVESASATNECE